MSSYQKNTSNNSGIVVDNLQVNKNANLPNTTFSNGITCQGDSTINNLYVSGTFTTSGGSNFVDTTSSQTITGDKQFTGNLTSDNINISGTSSSIPSYSKTPITSQTSSISGSTLTLSSSNLNVGVGQLITGFYTPISNPPTVSSTLCYINGTTLKVGINTGIQVGSIISGPQINPGTYVVAFLSLAPTYTLYKMASVTLPSKF